MEEEGGGLRRLDYSEQKRILRLLREEKEESCPSCGSQEFLIYGDGLLPYAGGDAEVQLYCPEDPHSHPSMDQPWSVRLTSAELQRAGIRTGL